MSADHKQRAERIAAKLREAEQLDPYNGQKHTTADWVMDAATEFGLQDFERRLRQPCDVRSKKDVETP